LHEQRHETGRLKHARIKENVRTVDELVGPLMHECQKQTQCSTRQIFTKTDLIQRSIVQIIHRNFGLKCLLSSNMLAAACCLLLLFFCIYILQNSVATQLQCGRTFSNRFLPLLPRKCANKKIGQSIKICQRCGQLQSGTFFETQCIIHFNVGY